MAWFDRNHGGKKSLQTDLEKPAEPPKPIVASEPPVVAPTAALEPKPAAQPPPLTAGLVGFLYKGSRVNGQLSFQGPVRIDGSVDGEINCQGTLTIGESAEVRAKIYGHAVLIQGKVEGNVTAKDKVELAAPGRLIGNIDSPRLVIAEGVFFDGDCSMGVKKQKGGAATPQSVSPDKAAAMQAPPLQADSKN